MARLQNRLKELRKAKNLTQQQLADIMEVSVYTVSLPFCLVSAKYFGSKLAVKKVSSDRAISKKLLFVYC